MWCAVRGGMWFCDVIKLNPGMDLLDNFDGSFPPGIAPSFDNLLNVCDRGLFVLELR